MVTQSIGAAVRLGVPELVSERPRPVSELAAATGLDAELLGRLLRALASVGVFAEQDGVIVHTELSELLRLKENPQFLLERATPQSSC
jgi:hypothetical protein